MKKADIHTELGIKSKLIDFLLSADSPAIIGCEIPFADKRRRADVVQITDNKLSAFEIKSAFDNLDKLSYQLSDYSDSFDYVSVVCDEKHLKQIKCRAANSIGIILVSNGDVTLIRQAKLRKRLSKTKLLSFVGKKYLSQIASQHGFNRSSSKSIGELRNYLNKKLSLSEAHQTAINFLLVKHRPSFGLFLSEKSERTNIEDVLLLSGSYSQIKTITPNSES